jgi:hypothetical protein
MRSLLALVLGLVFVAIALWHFYMAYTPQTGLSGGVPTRDGKPLFVPTPQATIAVGIVLLLFAGLVVATAGLVSVGLSPRVLSWLSYGLAAGLLARAIGEFTYVGFFKRVRDSRFATLDTYLYSPLCLGLAIGVSLVARGG